MTENKIVLPQETPLPDFINWFNIFKKLKVDLVANICFNHEQGESRLFLEKWKEIIGRRIMTYTRRTEYLVGVLSKQVDYFTDPTEEEKESDWEMFSGEAYKRARKSIFSTWVFNGDLPEDISSFVRGVNSLSGVSGSLEIDSFDIKSGNSICTLEGLVKIAQGYRLLHAQKGVVKYLPFESSAAYSFAREENLFLELVFR